MPADWKPLIEVSKPVDRIALQNAEFDAVTELGKQYQALTRVAVVDDDYPEARHRYESALVTLFEACKANGRNERGR